MSVRPRKVLIIGGGAAGLVTLRNLLEHGGFDKVELVERRDDVGGVWYLDDPSKSPNPKQPRWPSPAYPNLVGNVLPEFLSYSKAPFPLPPSHPNQPFPTLSETHQYLIDFAQPFKDHIRLNTEVVRVDELSEGGWKVTLKDWNTQGDPVAKEEFWDAVVVAVCWYDNPVWPWTEGFDVLRERGLAKHAKWWRGPQGLENKRVLVLGNGNSSNDIAAQLAPVATLPVYRSIRRPAFLNFVSLPDERIKDVPPVSKYTLDPSTNKITATLTDGTVIEDIDEVQVGTGYRPYPSFIYTLSGPLIRDDLEPHRIPSLHRLILYAYNPTLAFIGTAAISFTPFPIADVTSIWLALAWAGKVPYPDTPEERLVSEAQRLEEVKRLREELGKDNPSSLYIYGVLGATEEDYAAGLKKDIVQVKPELKDVLFDWSEDFRKYRETMYTVKREALEWTREQQQKQKQQH